jgi:hypothetical protein
MIVSIGEEHRGDRRRVRWRGRLNLHRHPNAPVRSRRVRAFLGASKTCSLEPNSARRRRFMKTVESETAAASCWPHDRPRRAALGQSRGPSSTRATMTFDDNHANYSREIWKFREHCAERRSKLRPPIAESRRCFSGGREGFAAR